MHLADLQLRFWLSVRQRGAPPADLADWLLPSPRQSPAERLAVYHLAYWQRQVTALASSFPTLQNALGAAALERLMLAYVEARPCTEPCIERLGRGFVEFLALRDTSAHVLGIARLEWAQVESLLSPDASSLVDLPRGLGPALAECRLELVPSLHVEHVPRSSFAVFAPELQPQAGVEPAGSLDVTFFRPRFAVKYVALGKDEARALALAREGANIGLICAAFADLPDAEAASRALQVLSSWFARGWVAQCKPSAQYEIR